MEELVHSMQQHVVKISSGGEARSVQRQRQRSKL